VFVEYVMLNGINDAPETAHELGWLLAGRDMIVNLIPWNPVYSPGTRFEAPRHARVAAFQRILREDHGIFCTVRQEMGQDISGESLMIHSFTDIVLLCSHYHKGLLFHHQTPGCWQLMHGCHRQFSVD
jgi:hypothetical protein